MFYYRQSNFFWSGATKQTVTILQPQKHLTLTLFAGFFRPGVYNVNKIQLFFCTNGVENGRTFACPFQHMVTIYDTE